jgi:murein DD-endopeptidase MepM/ murein hydrolase activator NlpD
VSVFDLRRIGVVVASIAGLASVVARAEAPVLTWPLACTLGVDCIIQNYLDRDPSPGATDFACGSLTYNGHTGTDFRIADYGAMRRGVAVVAAAPGVVIGVRDGMEDVNARLTGHDRVADRSAGNAVAIAHGDGYETRYAHLRRGSVAVKKGDRVERGRILGYVGLSGLTEFPHLHLTVRRDRVNLDPFTGESEAVACDPARSQAALPPTTLWEKALAATLGYVATGLLKSGFSDREPEAEAIEQGEHVATTLARTAPAIYFWASTYGVRADDVVRFRVFDPDGRIFTEHRRIVVRHQAQRIEFVGKRRTQLEWPPGRYRGEFELRRGPPERQAVIVSTARDVTIE